MAFGGKTLTVYLAADLKKFNGGLKDAEGGLKGFGDSLTKNLGTAALGAAAAVGALATKMAIDGVKAAIEDEAAAAKLATTLNNLGLAHDTAPIEEYISSLEMAYGIADDQLRPAYDRLIRSTRDTAKANDALTLALDVAAGTGKSLDTVVQALGRAYDGNTTGLSRLGAGLDKATLKTGDMNRITEVLSATFGGQASDQADTFQGQLARVSLAADNVKEAFGKGFLSTFANTSKATSDLVADMKSLEASAESSGILVGRVIQGMASDAMNLSKLLGFLSDPGATWNYVFEDIAIDLRGLSDAEKEAARAANELAFAARLSGNATETAADKVAGTIPSWRDYDHTIRLTTDSFREYLRLNSVRMSIVREENKDYKDLAARQREVNTYSSIAVDLTDQLTDSRGGASNAANRQAIAENRLTKAFQDQQSIISGVSSQLQQATRDLESARKAAEDYAAGIAAQITSGINLGTAFEGQFDEAGQRTGASLLDGFNKQIEQAQYFGNVLTAIKAQGADQSLIEQIASLGPVTGAALGQQMLDEGLVKTLSDKWVEVQDQTKTLAMGLVPEFMTAGIASGEAMVTSLAEQVKNETKILTRLGRQIAKPVGAGFKAQFLKDIADAVAEVEAIQTAARAEKVAAATARGQILTEQAVAQALSQIIGRSDARLGVTNQPVLA